MFFASTTFTPGFPSQGAAMNALIAAAIVGSFAGAGYLLSYGLLKLLKKFNLLNNFSKAINLVLGIGLAALYFAIGIALMILNDSLAAQ